MDNSRRQNTCAIFREAVEKQVKGPSGPQGLKVFNILLILGTKSPTLLLFIFRRERPQEPLLLVPTYKGW